MYIGTENTAVLILFTNVSIISSHLTHTTRTLHINSNQFIHCLSTDLTVSIQFIDCTFNNNFALDHVIAIDIIANENKDYFDNININLSTGR